MKKTQVLILGGTGMLGHTLLRQLAENPGLEVTATVRKVSDLPTAFSPALQARLVPDIDAANLETLGSYLLANRPEVVINCIGLIKQLQPVCTPQAMIAANALLPHQLAYFCSQTGTRLIHISTDCVFSGNRGNYQESDSPDPEDLYGITKLLGEVAYPNCLTIRTSIIGHELRGKRGLVEWFLAQTGPVKGYTKVIYSGLPTIELARFIESYILPNPNLEGLWQLSAAPISKYELLTLIKQRYGGTMTITPDAAEVCDRSLDSTRLRRRTGYQPPSWDELVEQMFQDYQANPAYHTTKGGPA